MQETSVQFLGRKIRWRTDRLPTPVFLGFPDGSAGKESACNLGDLGSIPGLRRSPAWPGELHGLCSPWGHKESDTTEQLSFSGFRDSSVGKESAYNPGDPSLIPGLGKPGGEGIDYSLQYSWASLVAQLAKNPPASRETWVLPAMWETWLQSLGWEDPPGEGKGYPLQCSDLENSMDSS